MYAINTFIKNPNKKWTWRCANGVTKHEIDDVITDSKIMFQNHFTEKVCKTS